MSDGTKIEWSDATWNIINGCSVTSPGCTNCYAMKLAGTRLRNHPSRAGLTQDSKAGPVWTGETRFNEKVLLDPLKWKKPRKIFVCAHGDLFHESVPDEWIDKVFAVMALCPQHIFQVLTKRADRMREYMKRMEGGTRWAADILSDAAYDIGIDEDSCCAVANWINGFSRWSHVADDGNPLDGSQPKWPLPNVWLGVSVEDQKRADERIPDLLATPAAVRWLSMEPLLGPVDLNEHGVRSECRHEDAIVEPDTNALVCSECEEDGALDWIVVGGESGAGARPMHPQWARDLRDQCASANVPFLFKQWGNWLPGEPDAQPPFWNFQDGDYVDGHLLPDIDSEENWCEDWATDEFQGHAIFHRVAKAKAGRLLDGVQHDGYPEGKKGQ